MSKLIFLVPVLAVPVLFLVERSCSAEPKTVPPSAEKIQQLIAQLDDDRFEQREEATRQLTQIGPAALPALRAALKDARSLEVRYRVERILDTMKSSLPYLLDCLRDKDAKTRKEAAERLAELGNQAKPALPALVELLKDKDEEVRDAAAVAVLTLDPSNKAIAGNAVVRATVGAKYVKLLRRIHVPQDKDTYTEFKDYGAYPATDYAGYTGIPAGYWVYVYPHWYIWGEQK